MTEPHPICKANQARRRKPRNLPLALGVMAMSLLSASLLASAAESSVASSDPLNPFAPSNPNKSPFKTPKGPSEGTPSQPERTGEVQASDKVSVAVIPSAPQPTAGQTHHLGVRFNIAPQWHIYYPGQNATGVPPQITLKVSSIDTPSAKITLGEPIYPAPKRYGEALELLDYVYEGSPVVLYPVFVPDGVKGSLKVEWSVGYTVCKDICLTGKASGTLQWGGTEPATWSAADQQQVTKSIADQPSKDWEMHLKAQWFPGRMLSITRLGRALNTARRITFYPHEDGLELADGLKEGTTTFNTLNMKFLPRGGPNVKGIVTIVSEDGIQHLLVDIPPAKEGGPSLPTPPDAPGQPLPVPNVPVRIPPPDGPTKR